MMAEPRPKKRPVEARTTLIGIPMPVIRVAIEAISRVVIAVITEVSLIDVAVARRLKRLVSLSRRSTSLLRNFSSSSDLSESAGDMDLRHHRAVLLPSVSEGKSFRRKRLSSFILRRQNSFLTGSLLPHSS